MADPAELIRRHEGLCDLIADWMGGKSGPTPLHRQHAIELATKISVYLAALTPPASADDAAVRASRLTITPKILRDAATTLADSKGDYEVAYVNAMARKQRTADMALREHWKHIEDFFWWVGEPARTEAAKPSKYDPSLDTVEHIAGLVAEGEHDKAVACLARMAGKVPTWQPIETAPKDGTKVLLWKHGWEYAPVAYWGRIDGEDGKFGAWLFENEDLCLGIDSGCLGWNEDVADGDMPTHWTPCLPTAPETPR